VKLLDFSLAKLMKDPTQLRRAARGREARQRELGGADGRARGRQGDRGGAAGGVRAIPTAMLRASDAGSAHAGNLSAIATRRAVRG
jgi:hypothetical protein